MPNFVQQRRISFILKEIGKQNYPSSKKLAESYEVSSRTILRDIEYLNIELGADIQYDDKKYGFYFASKPISINDIEIKEKDLFILNIIQMILEQYEGTPMHKTLQQVMNKIIISLPENKKSKVNFLEDKIIIKSEFLPKMDIKKWGELVKAISLENVIEITQTTSHTYQTKTRKVHPLAMLCDKKKWYLIAWDIEKSDYRHFGLWRIKKINILKEYFDYPKEFNPKSLLDIRVGGNVNEKKYKIKLEFNPWLQDILSDQIWFKDQKISEQKNGNILLEFNSPLDYQLKKWITSFGGDVKVLQPNKLIEEIKILATQILNQYK